MTESSAIGGDPSERGRRRGSTRRIGIVAAALPMILLSACGGSPAADPDTPASADEWVTTTPAATGEVDSVTWNLILEPARLDPAESNNYGESTVLANMCESLQRLDPDFAITDGLAQADVSSDEQTIVYTINPDATFWDGSPVTGADVAFSLTRAWKPTGVPYWTAYYKNVSSIEATGDLEVTVRLSQPDRLFQQMMATAAGGVVQKAYTEQHPDFGTPSTPPMCSGPYEFASWKSGSELVMERNEDYWGATKAKVPTVTFSFLQGDATQTTALTGGAIQGMYQPPYSGLGQLKEHGSVYYGKSLMTFYLVPTRKSGPLQDARIRRALFLAVDRQAVADTAFANAAVPARSLLAQSAYGDVPHETTSGTGGGEEELAEARALVEEAGSPQDEILLVGNPSISDSLTQTLQALAEAGKAIGLNTVYKSVTLGEFYGLFGGPEGWKPVNADGFGSQYNFPVPDPQTQFRIWADPEDYENYGGFADPQATALVEKAGGEPDQTARDEALQAADAQLFSQMPWVPVVDVANTLYMDKAVTGAPAAFVNWWYPWAADLGAS
jgi:peptide/nickel transport system substrate-binding protein